MLKYSAPASSTSDDGDWLERSEFWRNFEPAKKPGRKRKFNFREPLVLCGHGARINIDHDTLLVRNGFTHYPQKREEFRYFRGAANLPDRIVMIDGSGGITFDALSWMADQQIEFLRLDWRGEVSSFGGNKVYAANPDLVERQRSIKGTPKGIQIAKRLIAEKLSASIRTLLNSVPKSEKREVSIIRLRDWQTRLDALRPSASMQDIRGIEGGAAAAYFAAWQEIPIKWKGLGRRPISDSWRVVGPRNMTWRRSGTNARHPVNAMLNYGYAILKNSIRREVVAAGYDPAIGVMHGNDQNRVPLVYDLMEPMRPIVDGVVLDFVQAHTFTPGDFTINKWGGCRLNPQLAQSLLSRVMRIEKHGCRRVDKPLWHREPRPTW